MDGEPEGMASYINAMPTVFPIVGSFLLVFLPALGLLIAGLARLAGGTDGPPLPPD